MINVIIVDDEVIIRENIKKAIEWNKYGMELTAIAGSGMEALNIIDQYPPDIAILDIMLDDMDGLEILDIIKSKCPNTYVILISGANNFEYAQRAIELNAFCYLLKPVNINQLLNKLLQARECLQQRFEKLKNDSRLNEQLLESMPILRNNFFCEIVEGRIVEIDSILHKAEFLDIKLQAEKYAIIAIELQNPKNNSEYDRNLIMFAAADICKTAFEGLYLCYTFNLRDDIVLFIAGVHMNQTSLRDICQGIKEKINNYLSIPLTIGLGSIYDDLLSVRYSFKEALEALEYKMLIGVNTIIDSDTIYKTSNKRSEINPIKELFKNRKEELRYALKGANRETVKSITDNIIQVLHSSFEENIKNSGSILYLLSYYITEIVISLDIDINKLLDDENEIYSDLKSLGSIKKIQDYINSVFNGIMDELTSRQKDNNGFYVSRALEYINNNLYGEISLSRVADLIYVSSNYLSRIFKQELGESFIEYVIRAKMTEAKRLLETTGQKVYEIADSLNYKDINYFTKTFKKVFSVTPSEYRGLF